MFAPGSALVRQTNGFLGAPALCASVTAQAATYRTPRMTIQTERGFRRAKFQRFHRHTRGRPSTPLRAGCVPKDQFLAQGLFDFVDPVRTLEDFAGLGSVGGADDAVALHEVNKMSGAAVSDTQTALQ